MTRNSALVAAFLLAALFEPKQERHRFFTGVISVDGRDKPGHDGSVAIPDTRCD